MRPLATPRPSFTERGERGIPPADRFPKARMHAPLHAYCQNEVFGQCSGLGTFASPKFVC